MIEDQSLDPLNESKLVFVDSIDNTEAASSTHEKVIPFNAK